VRIGIGASKRTIIGKKKDADKSGIGTEITGIVCFLSIVGKKISSCPLLGIALNVMVMIGTTGLIGVITMIVNDLMGRLEGERRFMIGWGAGSVCMIDFVIVLHIFPGTKKSLRRRLMRGFPMSSYFAGMPMLIGWSQGKIVAHR